MSHYHYRRRSPWKLWIVPLLFLGLVGRLVYAKKDIILDKLGIEIVQKEEDKIGLAVEDEVTMSGPLSSSTNLRHYTMMLTSEEHGVVGVKSTMLDLSSYRSKHVTIRGKVSGIINNIPVINVASIVAGETDAPTPTQNTDTATSSDDRYVPAAGMILDPKSLGDYTVKNVGPSSVTFSRVDGDDVTFSYFPCANDKSATDCSYIVKQFETAESRFTGIDGDQWVQLPETNAWFGTNDNRIGYKIADVEKAIIVDLMHGVTFVNDRYVSKKLLPSVKNLCKTIDHTLNYVDSTDIAYQGAKITITTIGTDTESTPIKCVVSGNPADASTLSLVSMTATDAPAVPEEKKKEDAKKDQTPTDDTETTDAPTENTDEPVALGAELPFTSTNGGYTIVFPSNNIAFQGMNNTESLGIEGVSGCWTQMNVVRYSSAEHVATTPAVVMYDCRKVKGNVTTPAGYVRKDGSESDKTFFIKVINPQWKAFAEAIVVK